ncbi:hypothetical protein B296_00042316 [Ensete ventricosum]|uniref:Uncharacterized protein n=1 Tax=Ensete ventricosum TaxID=4639 RepID=A0A426Y4E0_ENSVE|nr:hypothetical protein B296_00042316 [Ensete ventricosum]
MRRYCSFFPLLGASPGSEVVRGHLYLYRRVGHMWATSWLPCLTSRQSPIVRGTVRWSVAVSALIRRLSPAVRGDMGQGHWSRIGLARQLYCIVCCQRGQLAGHRIAIGYPEIGSGVRRRPDVTES